MPVVMFERYGGEYHNQMLLLVVVFIVLQFRGIPSITFFVRN